MNAMRPNPVLLIALPILVLLVVGLLAGVVMLLANRKTRLVTLRLLGVTFVFTLLAGVVLYVSYRDFKGLPHLVRVARRLPTQSPEPVEEVGREPIVAKAVETASSVDPLVAEAPDAEGVATEVSAEESNSKSLLRAVGRALGKAVAEAKKNATPAPPAARPPALAPPAPDVAPEPPADRPDWVAAQPDRNAEGDYQMPIAVGPYSTRAECDQALPLKLHEAVDDYVTTRIGRYARGTFRLPLAYLQSHLVKDRWEEWRQYDPPLGKMVKLHVLLAFDREANARLEEAWNRVVVRRRLVGLGAAAAVLLALLSTAWAYLKIDLATGGLYRGRLRLGVGAAILAVVAAGAVVLSH